MSDFSEIETLLSEAYTLLKQGHRKRYEAKLEKLYQVVFPSFSRAEKNSITTNFLIAKKAASKAADYSPDTANRNYQTAATALVRALFPFAQNPRALVQKIVFEALYDKNYNCGLPDEVRDWEPDAKGALIVDMSYSVQAMLLDAQRKITQLIKRKGNVTSIKVIPSRWATWHNDYDVYERLDRLDFDDGQKVHQAYLKQDASYQKALLTPDTPMATDTDAVPEKPFQFTSNSLSTRLETNGPAYAP